MLEGIPGQPLFLSACFFPIQQCRLRSPSESRHHLGRHNSDALRKELYPSSTFSSLVPT